eukprot:CAMPEP_0197693650 /NCGR_PEP_ID=MMETSP1338-20131121/112810_1 /TAXON_ID=43686 ORGANISM="Pelagodinium beii, Strain RCC1491" /NCGR_SAMPLE_ID=MMETSP1338 /ASSEMBLY_ACC=CAM_ASM_000754 /LENGTH=115 /DNA_ID=CAMNT_0043276425 /DNA_START=96 /DNA_END=443 /DNA_ORIENTATION=-
MTLESDNDSIETGTWICEMALWSEWYHTGMLVSDTSLDVIAMDAEKFCEVCSQHSGLTTVILQKLAILSVAHLEEVQREGGTVSDIGFGPVIWNQLWYRAQQFRDRELKDILGSG